MASAAQTRLFEIGTPEDSSLENRLSSQDQFQRDLILKEIEALELLNRVVYPTGDVGEMRHNLTKLGTEGYKTIYRGDMDADDVRKCYKSVKGNIELERIETERRFSFYAFDTLTQNK